jgi:hypothetical protein
MISTYFRGEAMAFSSLTLQELAVLRAIPRDADGILRPPYGIVARELGYANRSVLLLLESACAKGWLAPVRGRRRCFRLLAPIPPVARGD